MGMIGASITTPEDDFEVKVTVEETDFFRELSIKAVLPKRGETYTVMPIPRYNVSSLLPHKLKGFDTTRVVVETPDEDYDDTKRFDVRSINDYVLGITHDGEFISTRFLFAAYVNENNPIIDKILGHALKEGYVDGFTYRLRRSWNSWRRSRRPLWGIPTPSTRSSWERSKWPSTRTGLRTARTRTV